MRITRWQVRENGKRCVCLEMQSSLFSQSREGRYVTGDESKHVGNTRRIERFASEAFCGANHALTQRWRARTAQNSPNTSGSRMSRESGWNDTPTVFTPMREEFDMC